MRFLTSLLLLAMNPHSPSDQILFDSQSPAMAPWQVVNDGVMGGLSSSRWHLTSEAAVFQGSVSLENNGGFASVRSASARHDLAGCDIFVLRVRGDGRRYKFTVRTHQGFDGAVYQTSFMTKPGEWEDHRLPLRRFVATFRGRTLSSEPPLDASQVTSIGLLIADQQAGPFRLEVAWIRATSPSVP